MNHGELVQKLRRERHLTQAYLAAGISSRTALSSFENGGENVSADTLFAYCERMNITLEEYEFLHDDATISRKRTVARFLMQHFDQPYQQALADCLHREYVETKDFFYYSMYAQYVLIKKFGEDSPNPDPAFYRSGEEATQIVEHIERHLDAIHTWGRFELILFANCLFIFDDDFISIHLKHAVAHMRIYGDSANYSTDLTKFLINGTQLAYERDHRVNLERFLHELALIARECGDTKARLVNKIFATLQDNRDGEGDWQALATLRSTLTYLGEQYWLQYVDHQLDVIAGH